MRKFPAVLLFSGSCFLFLQPPAQAQPQINAVSQFTSSSGGPLILNGVVAGQVTATCSTTAQTQSVAGDYSQFYASCSVTDSNGNHYTSTSCPEGPDGTWQTIPNGSQARGNPSGQCSITFTPQPGLIYTINSAHGLVFNLVPGSDDVTNVGTPCASNQASGTWCVSDPLGYFNPGWYNTGTMTRPITYPSNSNSDIALESYPIPCNAVGGNCADNLAIPEEVVTGPLNETLFWGQGLPLVTTEAKFSLVGLTSPQISGSSPMPSGSSTNAPSFQIDLFQTQQGDADESPVPAFDVDWCVGSSSDMDNGACTVTSFFPIGALEGAGYSVPTGTYQAPIACTDPGAMPPKCVTLSAVDFLCAYQESFQLNYNCARMSVSELRAILSPPIVYMTPGSSATFAGTINTISGSTPPAVLSIPWNWVPPVGEGSGHLGNSTTLNGGPGC
jgi:hypothetical protein